MAMTPLPSIGGTLFAGGGSGGGATASPFPTGGKGGQAQHLGSPHSGLKSTLHAGDPMSRAMGQYGKGHSFTSALAGASSPSPLKQIRGGTGQMRRIRGGLGPGKMGQPGGTGDYSMKSGDTE
jgi:hypothetical protein